MRKNGIGIGLCAAAIAASFLISTPVNADTETQTENNEIRQELVQKTEEKTESTDVNANNSDLTYPASPAPAEEVNPSQDPVSSESSNENPSVAEANPNSEEAENTSSNSSTQVNDQSSEKHEDITADMTEEEKKAISEEAYGLDKPDELTDEQLKEMGIDKDVYISNGKPLVNDGKITSIPEGVKYRLIGKVTFYGTKHVPDPDNPGSLMEDTDFDNVIYSFDYTPHHNADGSSYTWEQTTEIISNYELSLFNSPNFDTPEIQKKIAFISHIVEEIKIQPFEKGKVIHIDTNHQLNNDDLIRGYDAQDTPGAFTPEWVENSLVNVDITKVGRYDGAYGYVQYKNETGSTFGVPIVVCDPQGKTFNLKVNDPAPNIFEAVTVEPLKNDTSGLQLVWENPEKVSNDMKAPGTYHENVLVTYPDGSKGRTAVVTIIVSADPQQTDHTPDPDPDPEPTLPTSDPTPTPEIPDEPIQSEETPHELDEESETVADEHKTETAPVHSQNVNHEVKSNHTEPAPVKNGKVIAEPIKTAAVRGVNADKTQASLPQTGEKTNAFAMIGLALGAIGGLMFIHKRKEN